MQSQGRFGLCSYACVDVCKAVSGFVQWLAVLFAGLCRMASLGSVLRFAFDVRKAVSGFVQRLVGVIG